MEIRQRDSLFDNLKAICIILVVFGHMINVIYKFQVHMDETPFVKAMWNTIYLFHMPMFVWISGYFSKNIEKSNSKILEKLIIPYFLFNSLFYIMKYKLMIPILPDSAMWYLFDLIIWRLITPYINKINKALLLSICLVVIMNVIPTSLDDTVLSVIKFLPFYIWGLDFDKTRISRLRRGGGKIWAGIGILLIVAAVFILSIKGLYRNDMIYACNTLESSIKERTVIGLIRLLSGSVGAIMCLLLICIIPDKKGLLTVIGGHTMEIYLIHYLPVLQKAYQFCVFTDDPYIAVIGIIGLTILVICLLGNRYTSRIYNYIVNIFVKILVRDTEDI